MGLKGHVKNFNQVSYGIKIANGDTIKIRNRYSFPFEKGNLTNSIKIYNEFDKSGFECNFNLEGYIEVWKGLDLENEPYRIFKYEYQKDHLLKKISELYGNGQLYKKEVVIYNSDKKIKEKQEYNSEGELRTRDVYTYKNNNRFLETKNVSVKNLKETDKWEYSFDGNGNVTTQKYWQYGKLYAFEEFKYNVNNQIVEYVLRTPKSIGAIELYEYNSNNQLVKKYDGKLDGSKELGRTYQYDSIGNVNECISINPMGKEKRTSISYTYDENSNWIKSIIVSDDDLFDNKKSTFIVERSIEYFK